MNSICIRVSSIAVLAAVVLMAAGAPAQDFPADEAAAIGVLTGDGDWVAKQYACRKLRQVGTAQSVSALAALLADEKLSHMARYALEAMPCPEAGQALRDAVGTTEGMARMGVIISLGARCDAAAVPVILPLLNDADAKTAAAAAGALGRIATPEAVSALTEALKSTPAERQNPVTEGLLAAAERMVANGRSAQAVLLLDTLTGSEWPSHVRMGAFRARAYADPTETDAYLLAALKGEESALRGLAASIIAETSGEKSTQFFAQALPKLSPEGQAALLIGLAERGDRSARAAVAEAVNSPNATVKIEALKALAVLGSAEDVPVLVAALASDDAGVAAGASESLLALEAEGTDAEIEKALSAATTPVQAKLVELLGNRRADQAVPIAIEQLAAKDAALRLAGLRVLGLLGRETEAAAVVAAMSSAADDDDRSAAEKALTAVSARSGAPALPVLLEGMSGAKPEVRIGVLRAVGLVATPEALNAVVAALEDADKPVSDEAVRILSNWSTLDAAPFLEKLARSEDLNRQVLGLRGYVRLAGVESAVDKKAAMLNTAMELATRPTEKKLVLGAWGKVVSEQSLGVLRPNLDDAEVRNEAASAIVAVARELGKQDATRAAAVEALRDVTAKCENGRAPDEAKQLLGEWNTPQAAQQ